MVEAGPRYQLVIPDLPGHGESAPREGPLTLRGELDGLDAAIRKLEEGERVILIGNAFGGWLSLIYAREHPERVERLVLVNSVGLSFDAAGLDTLPENREQAQRMVQSLGDPNARPAPGFVLKREVTLRLLNGLPGARLHILPRCGHLPQQQCTDAFLKTLLEILGSPPPPIPEPFSPVP